MPLVILKTGDFMNKVGFITNIDKDPELIHTKELTLWTMEMGCQVLLNSALCRKIGIGTPMYSTDEIYEKADFVVVLGGDGTILRVARRAAKYGTPILGINFGTLGYLADVEKSGGKTAIEKVLKGNYKIEKRMMLEAYIERGCVCHDTQLALNEVCVNNANFSRMISLSVEVNDEYINTFRADGIIVSTPTGSTAYNLSAGGPILNTNTELMTITHICPHALYARPIVVSGDDIIKIKVAGDYSNTQVTFDGQNGERVKNGDTVVIRRSKYCTDIIKTTNLSFFDILRRKMVDVSI